MQKEQLKEMDLEKSEIDTKYEENQPSTRKKGGLITMPFIIVNEAFEKVASYGLTPNMILYFMNEYHMGVAKGQNMLLIFGTATNFFPLLGAFLADSYLGRFLTIGFGSISALLGMIVIWLTAMIPQLRPPNCDQAIKENCKPATNTQYTILVFSFVLMAIGAGGVRPCSLAFGADQVDVRDNPKKAESRLLETFFSWYYASYAVAILLAFTVIVYIQDHLGWKIGFGIPVGLMFVSTITFFLASRLYIKQKPSTSLLTNFVQVAVVAYKNRKLSFPNDDDEEAYYRNNNSKLSKPTNKIRCLNKACIIQNPSDITPDRHNSNPWGVCSVEQVEELKALIRVIPLWSSSIMISINISQGAFGILQANTMDRHLTSGFEIPAGSFGLFIIVGAALWIGFYDRILLPIASKIRGKRVKIGLKTRMGSGLVVSVLAMIVSAIVEHIRRKKAIKSGFFDNPSGVVAMSALWLVPQNILSGIAESFNTVAQNEFYYSELPKSLSSIATVLSGLGLGFGSLIATFLLNTADGATKKGPNGSWFQDNINKGHFESYYWLLAIMSSINLIYFSVCSWAYGPVTSEIKYEGNEKSEQELLVVEEGVKKE